MPKKIVGINVYFVEELSKILGVSRNTLRIYFRDGKLKGKKLGGLWFVSESNLKKFLENDKEENKKDNRGRKTKIKN